MRDFVSAHYVARLFCLLLYRAGARLGAQQVLAPSQELPQLLSTDSMKVGTHYGSDSKSTATSAISKYKVFTYWEYKKEPNPMVKLNMKTWARHLPAGTEVIFVNDTNFFDLVPDAPEEFKSMPSYGSKSDIVRAAVLYHHGGLYMDTDFLVMKPLGEVFARLDEGWDVILNSNELGQKETGPCDLHTSFSSNFMAARRGNAFSRTWWENIKKKITRLCGELEFQRNKICCHEAFDPKPKGRTCKIPWGYLEHLKQPECDYDIVTDHRPDHCARPMNEDPPKKQPLSPNHPLRTSIENKSILATVERGNARADPFPNNTKLLCLAGTDGVIPHLNGEVYWQPWDNAKGTTGSNEKINGTNLTKQYDLRFSCREDNGGNLTCDHGNWGHKHRNYSKFFHRTAYHLFFTTRLKQAESEGQVFQRNWLLSEMYRRSLGPQNL